MSSKVKKHLVVLLLVITAVSLACPVAAQAKTSSATQWVCTKKKVKTKKLKKRPTTKTLKKKAKKTKTTTKTKKLSSKTSSKLSKNKKTKTKTTVKKSRVTTTKYKKGSKKVKVSEVIVTKTTTYTYKKKSKKSNSGSGEAKPGTHTYVTADGKPTDPYKFSPGFHDISELAPMANANVIKAFHDIGALCKIDPDCATTGVFSRSSRVITIQYYGDHIYHELGHFLFFVAGDMDETTEANAIYQAEMGKSTAYNKSYTNSTVKEYFAEAYLTYLLEGNVLKSTRPQTYAYVDRAVRAVTDAQAQKVKETYAPIWE